MTGRALQPAEDWRALGTVASAALGGARAQLHWAATAVEQVGKSLVPPVADHSHAALRWSSEHRALATAATPSGRRAALAPASAEVLVLGADGGVDARLALSGRVLDDIASAVRQAFAAEADPDAWKPLRREGLPGSRVAEGAAFTDAGREHRELASWYGNAAAALDQAAAACDEAGPVLCWPHHFDMATRLDFEPDGDPEEARSIGLGFSPGDDGTPEPYFYVLPWPAPDVEAFAPLPGPGEWVAAGFVGARLTGSTLLEIDAAMHADVVADFLSNAQEIARQALGL